MDGKPGIFSLLGSRLEWLGQRQKVLAQNIANADTPDYVPHDLQPQAFRRMVERQAGGSLRPVSTNAGHIQRSGLKAESGGVEQKERYETAPSGNAVVLEEQLIKVAQTQNDYNAITNLYKKQVSMVKLALRGRM